jgi:shikimate kinase
MMAVGKTTVGTLTAERLGWSFLDSDAQLVADVGRSSYEIFTADGDEELRILESRALVEALTQPAPVVVAVAGGAVLAEASRNLMVRSGVVVWLRASISTMVERVQLGGARPRLGDDPAASLRDLYRTREPLYAEVAQFVIDVDDRTPGEIVARILTETGLDDER